MIRRTLQRSVLIVVAGAALGLVANAVSPQRVSFITPPKVEISDQEFIPLAQARQLWSSGVVFFLDARSPADYTAGHIANALNLPAEAFDAHFPQISQFLTTDSTIVCYCDGTECDLSHHLAELLRQSGYGSVHILKNGWTDWSKAGYPTTTGAQP
jgi:rhodanese-related sulfurtransferase